MRDVTHHINGRSGGSAELDRWVYEELRHTVAAQLTHERGGLGGRGTDLNLTRVVHDVWLKLQTTGRWDSRAHFFGAAARATRQVLVSEARRAVHRDASPIPVDGIADRADYAEHVLAADALASLLEAIDERTARVLELRLFAGLSTEAIADLLGINRRTVQRDLRFATLVAGKLEAGEAIDTLSPEPGPDA